MQACILAEKIMVITFMPQKSRGPVNSNTNYSPQRFDESGGTPPPAGGAALVQTSTLSSLVQSSTLSALVQTEVV